MRSTHRHSLLMAICLLAISVCEASGQDNVADLVLMNGKIVTADEAGTEAQALAARGGRIIAIGSDSDIEEFIGSETEVIDLIGRTAIPGFIEGHAHYLGVGQAQLELNLMAVDSWADVVTMVEEAVAEAAPGQLISGRGWHQEKWSVRPEPNVDGLPYHASLSAVSPDNPVVLRHASGHATFANARAMELSGITAATPDPEGGEIVHAPNGDPIGAFRETAAGLLSDARQDAAAPDPRRVALLAQEEAFSKGVTSFQDAGASFATVDLYKEMVDDGSLKIRIYTMIRESFTSLAENLEAYRTIGYGDNRLTVRSIKMAIDGALGSHGAWLLAPYNDLPSSSGLNTTPLETIQSTARLAMTYGYQFNVHAIGDRGNRETLDIFEEAYAAAGDGDYRWRIEHAQHLHSDDIPRFGQLGVIPAMQGVHATSDAPWVEPKLGAQRAEEGAYVWQELMRTGATIVNGTDAPVEDVDPIASYYASVSRQPTSGPVFFAGQRMSRMEALRSYTINGAYGAFEEEIKGSLEIGKLADITVLSQDITTIAEDRIPETEIVYTIVDGEIVFSGVGR
jgi:predicted amidohydrolase YtcJ